MVLESIAAVLSGIGQIALWLQAIGIIVVMWIVFQIVSWRYNRIRANEIKDIRKDMKRIENKIDTILRSK